jgi:hypothetical protein
VRRLGQGRFGDKTVQATISERSRQASSKGE